MASNANSAETYGTWSDEPVELNDPEDGVLFGFNLRRIIHLVRRNLIWVAAIMIISVISAVVITLLTTPMYTATSSVLVEEVADEIIQGTNLQPSSPSYDAERFLKTQVAVIKSRGLAERVVANEKLADDDNFMAAMGVKIPPRSELDGVEATPAGYAKMRKDSAIGLVKGSLSVELPPESRVIFIRSVSNSPEVAARIANAYAEAFIQSTLDRKFDSSAYARRFLADQLEEARGRLETSERELNAYSRAAGLIRNAAKNDSTAGDQSLSVTNNALVQLNEAATTAKTERITAEDRWKTIANENVIAIPQVIGNSAVQSLIDQRSQVQVKLAEERIKHKDGYPTIQTLKAQQRDLDARIQSLGNSIKRSIYLDYVSAREKEQSLLDQVGQVRNTALSEQDSGVQYNLLKRVAETNRSTYDALLERYNQLSATAGAASNNVSLVDQAQPPSGPSSPNMVVNLMAALLVGALASALLVIMRDYFDDTIRSPGDVEQKLGLPLMGLIPGSDSPAEALGDPKSAVSESYHSLVTNLGYSTPTGLPHILAVTSGRESEGKTTTTYAIALDLARLGKRVVLIDLDLRRPTLHRRLDNVKQDGITMVLTGQKSVNEVLVPSDVPNLSFMTALPIPAQPSILLGGPNLGKVINEIGQLFDVVIIDCPPMLGLSDTASIAQHADGVLLMIDASRFHRGSVKSAVRRLQLIKAKLIGVALSKFDPKEANKEYGYYGYNYYSYGHDANA